MPKFQIFPEKEKYNLPLWQTPSFNFFLIGIFITLGILAIYFVREKPFVSFVLSLVIVFGLAFSGIFLGFFVLKAFEKASEINLLKTRFLSIVADQMRPPITAIKWVLTFLRREKNLANDETFQAYLEEVDLAEKRISRLVKNITTALAIDEDRLFFQKQKISLEEILKTVIERLSNFAQERRVKIKTHFEKVPEINQDPAKVDIIFENLLDNAIRHSKKTGGEVSISLKQERGKILVEFQDNGIGIPEEEASYVFQMFFKASNIDVTTQGTGLGLYICKRLLEKMGGEITFESKKDVGTTFRVYFPIK